MSVSQKAVNWFESLVLRGMTILPNIKEWVDVDKDGDVDFDDIQILYQKVMDFLSGAAQLVPEWPTLTVGQRIDRAVDFLKEKFPNVKTSFWVILEGLAYLMLLIRGKLGKG